MLPALMARSILRPIGKHTDLPHSLARKIFVVVPDRRRRRKTLRRVPADGLRHRGRSPRHPRKSDLAISTRVQRPQRSTRPNTIVAPRAASKKARSLSPGLAADFLAIASRRSELPCPDRSRRKLRQIRAGSLRHTDAQNHPHQATPAHRFALSCREKSIGAIPCARPLLSLIWLA
jgi:hypothetical protein